MGGLRFEAWTLPWSGSFDRVIADIPVVTGEGTVRLNGGLGGQMTVPADYDRLSDIISDTAGRLIRVYDGSTIVHEYLAERVDFTISETDLANISGGELASVFDRAVIYPYDYPVSPSTFPNHVWDGPDVLDNSGFELQATVIEIYDVYTDASGGTFTLTVDGQTTSAINYNASATNVNNALEALSTVTDVLVAGVGTAADPWRIEFIEPKFPAATMTGDGSSLTGGTLTIDLLQDGDGSVTQSWTKSQRADARSTPAFHGEYTTFRQSTGAEPVRTGSYSQVVSGTQYAGLQQIVQVEPGGVYQASIWINSDAGSQSFRLVVRDRYEGWIAQAEISPAVDTWTQVSITDVTIPAGVTEIVFRAANINATPSGTWYFDDASFAEGHAASNVGVIVTSLMDDAASDHSADTRGTILDWIDYSGFDATNDSSSTAWADTESFTAYRGASYGQTWDHLVRLNYEWRLTPKASPGATTHDLEWYASGNLGTDYSTAATPAINVGAAVTGGAIIKRIPELTAVIVEGAEGIYLEAKDSTAESNFGRFEKYRGDVGLGSTTSLTALAQHMLDSESAVRTSIQVNVVATPDHPRPLVDFSVGDILNVQLPPTITKTAKRVESISYRHGEPTTYQISLVEPPA